MVDFKGNGEFTPQTAESNSNAAAPVPPKSVARNWPRTHGFDVRSERLEIHLKPPKKSKHLIFVFLVRLYLSLTYPTFLYRDNFNHDF